MESLDMGSLSGLQRHTEVCISCEISPKSYLRWQKVYLQKVYCTSYLLCFQTFSIGTEKYSTLSLDIFLLRLHTFLNLQRITIGKNRCLKRLCNYEHCKLSTPSFLPTCHMIRASITSRLTNR